MRRFFLVAGIGVLLALGGSVRAGGDERVPESTLAPQALPSATLTFVAITPCRLADTRAGQGFSGAWGPPALSGGVSRDIPITGRCGIPAAAAAVSANFTAANTLAPGFLALWPQGTTWGGVSTLNYRASMVIANAAVVPLGDTGAISVMAGGGGTDLIIDVNGYYAASIGTGNTALGQGALQGVSTGTANTAVGYTTMDALTTGTDNAAVGARALGAISDSKENAALGAGALGVATAGPNTAAGFNALAADVSGTGNTAVGHQALSTNVDGTNNTAVGDNALSGLTAGSGNIGIGKDAGINKATGNNNIYIGAPGSQTDASVIRIGTAQSAAYIAGIYGTTGGPSAVYVDSFGKLGTVASSRRYKRDIEDLGDASDVLLRLRPVTFRYNEDRDPSGERQYGLIAEEVAQVAPELVVFDKDGRPETVKYHLVNAMLLNEVIRARREAEAQRAQIEELRRAVERLARRVEEAAR